MSDDLVEDLAKMSELEVKENVNLRDLTSIKVGGAAKYFIVTNNVQELINAFRAVIEMDIPYFILGAGTNVVISDDGFDGLVIRNESGEVTIEGNEVVVDSGIKLSILIKKLAELDLGGMEFLAGVPGTLGGAVVNNAGAFGDSISNHIKSITLLDPKGEVRIVLKEDLRFGYRTSIFKQIKDSRKRGIILRVRLVLRRGRREEIARKIGNYLRLRTNQPRGLSCGSFFKNPKVKKVEDGWESVVREGRIPAGILLERIGAKGQKVGYAYIPNTHANWIINKGRAKASEIKTLAESLKDKVRERYDIDLEEEIEYIGFG
jgi:UDP-N-acetylmuramate dehydrogenase